MMAWITPKTNWTSADYYNYDDLNRVENNTSYLKTEYQGIGYISATGVIDTSKTMSSITFYDDLNRIENNIKAIKDASYEPLGWSTPKTTWETLNTFVETDANRLESNLVALQEMLVDIVDGFICCGDAQVSICGKGNTLF